MYNQTVAKPRPQPAGEPLLWDSLDCHNPTVHKIGDEYVVFYIGVGVKAQAPVQAPASSTAPGVARPDLDKAQSIGAAWSTSLGGQQKCSGMKGGRV